VNLRQSCGDSGPGGTKYHDADGNPLVNLTTFPDLKAMTDHAHSLGLKAGWYGNNCLCAEQQTADSKYYKGDVNALIKYGFDSVKLDSCGAQVDMGLWYDLFNASGKAITIENCHQGRASVPFFQPTLDYCPFHMFVKNTP